MSADSEVIFNPVEIEEIPADEAFLQIIGDAVQAGASDVFFTSDADAVRISVRHLGVIRPWGEATIETGRRLIGHTKTSTGMDVAERRKPQDGRRIVSLGEGKFVDVRANSIPTLFGEDVSIRLFDREHRLLDVSQLGLTRPDFQRLEVMLNSPSGLVLVTGPTGSGKSTTLYACLQHLNDGRRKINTIEDPIEYALAGIRQSQILPKHGVDFPDLLRSVMRQSPDVIMIGEIRDPITAATAVRAANSGHLVFATLHAPVAAAAVQSLRSLGVHAHFLATALLGVLSQRLVRTLDPETKIEFDLGECPHTFDDIQPLLAEGEGGSIFGPGAPRAQSPDGYIGRTAVFEVLAASHRIRELISEGATADSIQNQAIAEGMVEFRRGAMVKVAQGETSTEEVLRTVPTEYLGLDF